jgi:Rha family phage regulatory protein
MHEVTIHKTESGIPCVSSLQVAEDFGKKHKNVIQAIESLIKASAENSANIQSMFIESQYDDNYSRKQKCYDLTRDGFSLLVMGFTGKEALDWKLRYIDAFNRMEQTVKAQPNMIEQLRAQAAADRAAAMRMNAETRRLKMLLSHPEAQNLTPEAFTAESPTAPKRPKEEKTYSATEVGRMLGVSAMRVGQTANRYGLKNESSGFQIMDKSKKFTLFRYNKIGVMQIADALCVDVDWSAV